MRGLPINIETICVTNSEGHPSIIILQFDLVIIENSQLNIMRNELHYSLE